MTNSAMQTTDITFVIPSRNTIDYLKIAYNSIRRHYPENNVIVLDESDADESYGWIKGASDHDPKLRVWKNNTGRLLGHTITYDLGIDMAKTPLVCIFHSDMVCSNGYLENLLKWWKPQTVVCATRVEPEGIYGPGREKILKPFGALNTDFKQLDFDLFVEQEKLKSRDDAENGIFAPWLISKEDFKAIGGHDHVGYAPYPTEDSDIFIRFVLAGYNLIQSRDSLCYHFISKGHRNWAKNGIGHDDSDFKFYLTRSVRNYQRKWNRMFSYNEFHHPIIHPVYDLSFVIQGACSVKFLSSIEPWCQNIYVTNSEVISDYLKVEQFTTNVDLSKRIHTYNPSDVIPASDVTVHFSESDFMKNPSDNMAVIQNLNQIITNSVSPSSTLVCGIFKMYTKENIRDLSKSLVKVTNPKINL